MLGCASFLVGLSGLVTLIWMIYASLVIFGDKGMACKEKLLSQSGQFIYVWLIIVYCTFGLLCCCTAMLVCVMTNNRKKKRAQRPEGSPML